MKLSKEIKVSLLAIVAAVILFLGVRFLKGTEVFSRFNTYYVVYDNIEGLTTSNPVMINGYKVGQVMKIELEQNRGNSLLVTMNIDEKILLGEGATTSLVSSDLLGSKALYLKVGDISQPIDDGDTLRSNVELGIVERVQAQALPITEKLDSTLARVNQILGANDQSDMSNIIGTLVGDTTSVSAAVNNLEGTTRSINDILQQNERGLNATIANLELLTRQLSDPENGVGPLLAKLNQKVDSLQIQSTIEEFEAIAQTLNQITTKMNEGEGSMGKLLNDDSLYTNLNSTARDLDLLLVDFRENPKRYVHFSVFGGGKDKDKKKDGNE
ncbi:MlaD family protein [Tunicatimonas pelagia]|uniref:MlaD family protein n=1 Tax=Tunicatimonas pelagia TaxID=931531 RepID=UPI002665ACF1|nr:MlaD family protein [Tunicatimonas pelagia]WKN45561.1 MlaD family protein [Tunicatimonas pelagia]